MNMTFDDYILNPMGKSNAVFNAITREAIRKDYTTRFNNILLRDLGEINFFFYKDSSNNTYYIHVKVPSEVVKDFFYDVVIKFFADSKVKELGKNLNKYYVQFFSNDPAFVFTYAHTFMKNGLFLKELMPKMSQEAIKERAKIKNPKDINGYVKSIYFAYLFIQSRGLNSLLRLDKTEPYDLKKLMSNVMDADTKIKLRQEEGAKVDKRKKIKLDKNTVRNISSIGISDEAKNRLVTTTTSVQKVKHTKASKGSVGVVKSKKSNRK